MSRFVDEAIARAGLGPVQAARRAGDVDAARRLMMEVVSVDLLPLGALADAIRSAEAGDEVRIHLQAATNAVWVRREGSELDLLRAVATARIVSAMGARLGVDWGDSGLELAQVALGFGATDLTGPLTRKSGTLISEDDLKKVKGQGMVAATALKRREIAALVRNAGRNVTFTDDPGDTLHIREEESLHV